MEGAEIGDAFEDQEFKPLPEHFEVVTIDVQPDEEVLEYTQEIPPPDEGFLRVCAAIDPNMSEQLRDSVWTQVCTMVEKVDLDVSSNCFRAFSCFPSHIFGYFLSHLPSDFHRVHALVFIMAR
ncbi:unnamed protein product [Nippostrongylus brasiliensis]|uniref:Intraflagellar transport protein 46 homolog n=1 Tax=Nippostrongylus brasiliensis TaxID=27835 RepID=A0A0N4XLT5_NIPBR|nr:unnamed protein product [Nippostrongylus brasiliensis]